MSAFHIKKDKNNSQFIFIDELPNFARAFAKALVPGDVVSLTGKIGAGKTTFVNALMQVLGIGADQAFSSPTFTVLNQYRIGSQLVNHLDLYRLNRFEDFEALDLLKCLEDNTAVTFVEWGDKFSELQTAYSKKINFEYVAEKSLERLLSYEGFQLGGSF